MKTKIYRVMKNRWDWSVDTYYFYNLWEAEAFLYEHLYDEYDDEDAKKIGLNYDDGVWSLYEVVTEDEPLSAPMDQALRNVIDAIVSECSHMMTEINESAEYFHDWFDKEISDSYLWIKNLLLKYAMKHDEETFRQNSVQKDPWDNGSNTWKA